VQNEIGNGTTEEKMVRYAVGWGGKMQLGLEGAEGGWTARALAWYNNALFLTAFLVIGTFAFNVSSLVRISRDRLCFFLDR
jgi:hypothetical protein